jgi:hypothetical protein
MQARPWPQTVRNKGIDPSSSSTAHVLWATEGGGGGRHHTSNDNEEGWSVRNNLKSRRMVGEQQASMGHPPT